MIDHDLGAHRVLAGVEMREQPVAAAVFDVAHHHRRGVDHAFLAHEANATLLVNADLPFERKIFLQSRLHGALYPARSTAFLNSARFDFAGSKVTLARPSCSDTSTACTPATQER